jgi:tetraacyldisaccharide 4'-kinase
VGDEPVLIAKRAACPVVVGRDRVAAVQSLLAQFPCDVVISDDGLQHYRLDRQMEVVVVDGRRRFGNQRLLPAGPLREPVSRLQEVDVVVAQHQALAGEYLMTLVGRELVSLALPEQPVALAEFSHRTVHAVAAIGHPAGFFAALREAGFTVIEHVFPDHYRYEAQDFMFGDDLPIVMTEKDAVKCQAFADARFWYLPVSAEVDAGFLNSMVNKLGVRPCSASERSIG